MNELEPILNSLTIELTTAVKTILMMKGIKNSSNVMNSIKFTSGNDMVNFMVNDYFESLSTGRKAGGKKVPIRYILDFIKQNSIQGKAQSKESLAFAIAKSIKKRRKSSSMPPTEDLYDWMSAKGITPKQISPNSLAFAIQTSIYKHGIRALNFMDTVNATIGDISNQRISTGVQTIIEDALSNIKIDI